MATPWQTLERSETPDGVLELRLRGEDDYLVCIDGRILMNSHASRSERALAERACERVAEREAPRVLVGGLGMGLTLRAALDALPATATVVVAELNPVIVDWCRGPLAATNHGACADPRVEVRLEDAARTIAASRGLDAILLDLYEGPHAHTPRKDPFYGNEALHRTWAALAPGGVFAVWSEDPDPDFEARLRKARFEVTRHRPGRGGRRHAVTIAVRQEPKTRR
ncbi:MAG: spermidine synthase [Deltaproteobacteria bacterium]|nr:spermidine synthase [Deltaproteobacteria bacterium]MBW2444605.1 spermidine synthase [Deltaproteobacteria bacterium]